MAARGCEGKIDGRHISIIVLSEHHVDYGGSPLSCTFSPMCTSDGLDLCTAPGF